MTKREVWLGHIIISFMVILAFLISKLYWTNIYFIDTINLIETIIYIVAALFCYRVYKKIKNSYFLNLMLFLIFSLIGDLIDVYYTSNIYHIFYFIAYVNVFLALDKLYKHFMLFKFNKSVLIDTLIFCYVFIYTILLFFSNNILNELYFDIVYVIFDVILLFYIVMNVLKMTSELKIRRHVMYIIASLIFYFVADLIYFVVGSEINNIYTGFADILYCYTALSIIFGVYHLLKKGMKDTITSYIKSSLKSRNLEVYFVWLYSILLLIFVISYIKLHNNFNLNLDYTGVYVLIFSLMVFRMFSNIKIITQNVKWFEYENIYDKLTQFYKREKLPEILNKIKMFRNRVYPISLMLIDIDEMQAYNSKYGVEEGDNRIRTLSALVDRFLGEDSICVRYGGDEFLVIFIKKEEKEVKDRISKLTRYVAEQNKVLKEKIAFTFYNLTLNEQTDIEKALYNVEIKLSQKRIAKKQMVNELIEEKNRKKLEEQQVEVLKSFLKIVQLKDSYTEGHSNRVAEYAILIAREMNLPENQVKTIYTAGLLHDIGKVLVPTEILNKNGPLTQEEWSIMSKHPIYGYEIVSSLNILQDVAPLIRYHHERYDEAKEGFSGYPKEKFGEEIPLGARILAVADSFDAMITDRPYRKGMSMDKAVGIIKQEAGKQFDPKVVEVFINIIEVAMSF